MVVRFPSLDEPVAAIRADFGLPRKRNGIPPHVTLIVPFLPASDLDPTALDELRALCARFEPFAVRFASTGRFPSVLYLEPDPARRFVELTEALIAHWPQLQPYAGAHTRIVPHLTITTAPRAVTRSQVVAAVESLLPHTTEVSSAQLFRFDGRRWTEGATLPLGSQEHRSTSDPT